jgi:hypothetical protein
VLVLDVFAVARDENMSIGGVDDLLVDDGA